MQIGTVGIVHGQKRSVAVADLRQLQRLQGWRDDQVGALELHWAPGANFEKALPELDRIFLEESTDQDSVVIPQIVSGNYRHIYDWLDLLDLNVLIILVLMIVVSGFNMISGLLILLFERIQMIGLFKALGMRTRQICSILKIEKDIIETLFPKA